MADFEVVWTDRAKEQLANLWEHYCCIPDTGRRLLAELVERVELLGKFPMAGPIDPYFEYRGQGHRFIMVGRFRIVYRITDDQVWVTMVIHSKANPSKAYFVAD